MKISVKITAVLAMLSAPVLCANEVVATAGVEKSRNHISLDVVSDGNATGFQFSIPIEANARNFDKSLDLSGCLADLPKSHTGKCVYRAKKNDILVIVYSLDNALLPEGVVGVGSIRVPGVSAKAISRIAPVFASPEGKQL